MIDQIDKEMLKLSLRWPDDTALKYIAHRIGGETITISPPLIDVTESFTRSNGTLVARLYERLTKASRRRVDYYDDRDRSQDEAHYRRGVKDAYNALRDELS